MGYTAADYVTHFLGTENVVNQMLHMQLVSYMKKYREKHGITDEVIEEPQEDGEILTELYRPFRLQRAAAAKE